ncbi:hypothetical protein IV454_23800 [Massilia antarctica]|uniref:CPBP family intramembrane metalloprotease n=1 Tax=Massilia antarctica TaxID=2765360 RepID=A0AA49A785_9BURK|nr:hypothetical protein [Massilia antarctica]QPI48527.1 hypothetical protein IV454_23800 [Massilia antarctica]
MHVQSDFPLVAHRRRAAMAIGGTTALALIALSHHPVAGKASSVQESLTQLVSLQLMDGVVHGALIVMLALLAGGFAVFGALLGRRRPSVIMGLSAYGLGCCIVVGAMLIDGFAVPQLARQFVAAPPDQIAMVYVVLRVLGTLIQVLTKAGLLSMCVALLAWSYALASAPSWPWSRLCAALGVAAGLLPGLFLLVADIRLAPGSLMAIFGAHAVWNLGVAALLLRSGRQA